MENHYKLYNVLDDSLDDSLTSDVIYTLLSAPDHDGRLGSVADPTRAHSQPEEVENGIVGRLRKRFRKLDTDNSRTVSISELMKVQTVSEETDIKLLQETERFRYKGMHVADDDDTDLTDDEWVHYKLLRFSAPSWIALEGVNKSVRRMLGHNSGYLKKLLSSFAVGDVQGNGKIPKNLWPKVFGPLCGSEDKVQKLCGEADFNDDSLMDYYEFTARLLVGEREEVQLAMYDISNGWAGYVPAMLLSGHKFEYIYHTGVLAFGKEFWYGGGVFASEPGTTPFGEPVKVQKLGLTVRTKPELIKYLTDHLRWEYTYATYDVLHHNCNCFSNDVVQFLLDGQQIPEEVRMQPVWAENGVAVQAITPILNRWLGGFGQGNDAHGYCRIDDMTDVWRSRLQGGDLAMWQKRFIDLPDIVRIANVDHTVSKASLCRFAKVKNSKVYEPKEVTETDVPLREFHPIPGFPTSQVIARSRPEGCPPCCINGHPLEATCRFSVTKPPACGVCGNDMPRRLMCVSNRDGGQEEDPLRCRQCKWEMCGVCVAEGRRMQAGHNGGVFSDVLTIPLAAELIKKSLWLRFKAYSYFGRADQDTTDMLEREELDHLKARLCQELDLTEEVDSLSALTQAMDFELFVGFFKLILEKAVRNSSHK